MPPLRRVPAAAEALAVRQTGSVLELQWRAPSRNQDGTTEDVDLREVEVLRRVIDLDALVQAQTQPLEPEEAPAPEEEPSLPPEEEPVSAPEENPAPEDQPAPAETTPAVESGVAPASEEPSQTVPERPPLQIPAFRAEAVVITTLPSTELGAELSYKEDVEPDWIGKRVEYALIYTNRKKRASPLSKIAQIDPLEELSVPGAPAASVGDGRVELRWPAGAPSESAFFSVYKRAGDAPSYPTTPLNSAPIDTTEFVDEGIVFGRPVCYAVRRVVPPPAPPSQEPEEPEPEPEEPKEDAQVPAEPQPMPRELVPFVPPVANPTPIESLLSAETCLTPEDTFPPETPTGLIGVSVAQGILLTWDIVRADDLAGYRVYRSSEPSGPFELLNQDIVTEARYTDETAVPGETYYYAVTAVDATARVNESARSETAQARRLAP